MYSADLETIMAFLHLGSPDNLHGVDKMLGALTAGRVLTTLAIPLLVPLSVQILKKSPFKIPKHLRLKANAAKKARRKEAKQKKAEQQQGGDDVQ